MVKKHLRHGNLNPSMDYQLVKSDNYQMDKESKPRLI